MRLIVSPSQNLQGDTSRFIPGDKSISHRAALFASLAEGISQINNFQVSGVTLPMLQALTALGVNWNLDDTTLQVWGRGISSLKSPAQPIHCGNSATTLRLLTGAIVAAGISAIIDVSEGLRRRPMKRIIEPLSLMGAEIISMTGCAPLEIRKREANQALRSLHYLLPVASAQVKTCLLLAALGTNGVSRISEPGPSRDHSERLLSSMGVQITTTNKGSIYEVEMNHSLTASLNPVNLTIPADPSAAAFLIIAALITLNSTISINQVCLNPTRTGLIDVLREMGADIEIHNEKVLGGEPVGDLTIRSSRLRGTNVNGDTVVRMIDEFPIFAIAAACAEGTTLVRDAKELRIKESDRISMLAKELGALGVTMTEFEDGFSIYGGKITGGEVNSHGDHRLAMSLAVAGLISKDPVIVNSSECIHESFPCFAQSLTELGADLVQEEQI